jgi:integrase
MNGNTIGHTPVTPVVTVPTAKARKKRKDRRNLILRGDIWYFKKVVNGERKFVSLGTDDFALAKAKRDENLRKVSRSEMDQIKGVRSQSATLAEIFKAYDALGGITKKAMNGYKSMMLTVCRKTLGKDNPEAISLDELTKKVARDYQDLVRKQYETEAGDNEKDRRSARDRADRTTKSTLRQAKALFSVERGLVDRYREAGLVVPECVEEFCGYKAQGKITTKVYFPPSDDVMRTTFVKIEELRLSEPEVYDLFWTALGTGCRRNEVLDMVVTDFVELNGGLWIGAGLGKDGRQIQIPVINWPVHESSTVVPADVVRAAIARAKAAGRATLFSGKAWERVEVLARRLNEWLTGLGWHDEKKMHALRAFIGSKIYNQKPLLAQRYLRHKSIATTEKFYSHFVSLEGVLDLGPANVVPLHPAPVAAAN